jgi:transposase
MRRLIALAMALTTLGLAGCQQASQKTEAALEAKVCANLTAVGAALDQVAALKPTSTVGDATAANKALTRSLEALNHSEALLEKMRLRQFRDQLSAFNREATRVAGNKSLTLEEAAADLKTKAQPVIAARRRVSEQAKCPTVPAKDGK